MSQMLSIPQFATGKVLVVGDVMLDRYWSGATGRISPEAPVPVVNVKSLEDRLGGAANVAASISALDGQVTLVGAVGDDEDGKKLANLAQQKNIIPQLIANANIPTIVKLRVLSRGQQLLRLDFEQTDVQLDSASLANKVAPLISADTVVILSDYAKGAVSDPQSLIRAAAEQKAKVLVDPKGSDFAKYRGAFLLTPNRSEFEQVVGTCNSEQELLDKGQALVAELDLQHLLITRSEEGMTLLSQQAQPLHIATQAKQVFDVTGAGDTVIATLAASLAAGENIAQAVKLANLAAGVAVERIGTSTVSANDLAQAAHHRWGSPTGVISEKALLELRKLCITSGEKIVMTNGCFDLLHPGHVAYLEQAKALGDRLIVAVNDDASVKRLKGNSRPVNNLQQRMQVLAGLAAVDWVVPFSEDTPQRLISQILPDVLVKGGDYTVEQVAGGAEVLANGGKVQILDFVDGYSTTSMIERANQ